MKALLAVVTAVGLARIGLAALVAVVDPAGAASMLWGGANAAKARLMADVASAGVLWTWWERVVDGLAGLGPLIQELVRGLRFWFLAASMTVSSMRYAMARCGSGRL